MKVIQQFSEQENPLPESSLDVPLENTGVDVERLELFIKGVEDLTATEKIVYESYLARMTTKEIMAKLNITENTLKYHNKNIYSKLSVSSRKELMKIYKQLKTVQKEFQNN